MNSKLAGSVNPRLGVWWIGQSDSREALAPRVWLEQNCRLACFPTTEAAALQPELAVAADAIIFFQAYPGEFTAAQVESLHRLNPLAALAVVLGTWCEGETRSGSPWPGVPRYYWRDWPRLRELLENLREQRAEAWLPRTASEVDRLVQGSDHAAAMSLDTSLAIHTPRRSDFDALACACRDWGVATIWLRPEEPIPDRANFAALLWDSANGFSATIAEWERQRGQFGATPTLLLADFLREEECEIATVAGFDAVLAKPFFLGDLHRWLAGVPAKNARATPSPA